jgi:hypothetical protein
LTVSPEALSASSRFLYAMVVVSSVTQRSLLDAEP